MYIWARDMLRNYSGNNPSTDNTVNNHNDDNDNYNTSSHRGTSFSGQLLLLSSRNVYRSYIWSWFPDCDGKYGVSDKERG